MDSRGPQSTSRCTFVFLEGGQVRLKVTEPRHSETGAVTDAIARTELQLALPTPTKAWKAPGPRGFIQGTADPEKSKLSVCAAYDRCGLALTHVAFH